MKAIYKAAPLSRKNIRDYVARIRKLTGTENIYYFPIVEFLEMILPQLIGGFCYEICSREEMPTKYGETFPAENKICIREDIYENALAGDAFARYTIAHEIGHLLLNDVSSISLCRLADGEELKPYEDPEWQADCFGGGVLMYHPLIKGLTPAEISEKCGVTPRAARVQSSKA